MNYLSKFFGAFLILLIYSCSNKTMHSMAFVMPVFLDSLKLEADLLNKSDIKNAFNMQKKTGWPDDYCYMFSIDSAGNVKAGEYQNPPDITVYKNYDTFIKDVFNNYKWIPAQKNKGGKNFPTISYGTFDLGFDVKSKFVIIEINVTDGNIKNTNTSNIVYFKKIAVK